MGVWVYGVAKNQSSFSTIRAACGVHKSVTFVEQLPAMTYNPECKPNYKPNPCNSKPRLLVSYLMIHSVSDAVSASPSFQQQTNGPDGRNPHVGRSIIGTGFWGILYYN